MTHTKKWEEPRCKCYGILDFEDGFYICVNPDCEIISIPSTLIEEYND